MNKHTINEGFGAPLFSARARVAFGSGITPLADRDVLNASANSHRNMYQNKTLDPDEQKYVKEKRQCWFSQDELAKRSI